MELTGRRQPRSAPRVLPPAAISVVCYVVGAGALGATVAAGLLGGRQPLAHPLAFGTLMLLLAYTHLRPVRILHRHGTVESDHLDEALIPV
ncbi:MAG TPA: hypothetical protein VJ872_17000, partial [Nocardioides sp.]|nr:hypothetical protein [Nocardioides sp.]